MTKEKMGYRWALVVAFTVDTGEEQDSQAAHDKVYNFLSWAAEHAPPELTSSFSAVNIQGSRLPVIPTRYKPQPE